MKSIPSFNSDVGRSRGTHLKVSAAWQGALASR